MADDDGATFAAAKARSDFIWGDLDQNPGKYRMLTGDRPTGSLHIGHHFGTLANRVLMQNRGVESYVIIADYQVLTDRETASAIQANVREIILDYLGVGLDPFGKETVIFCHSHIPELNQLLVPFLTLVSMAELERNPTVKEEAKAANIKSMSASLMTYPVHQAADILFCKGNLVPVGKDQLPHLELTRKIARRFNERYESEPRVFPEPAALLAEVPHILGLDGQNKMSKSLGNAVLLKWTPDETAKAVKKATTDSDRQITYDPDGRPEVANLLRLLSLTSDRSPEDWADAIGNGGGGTLKAALIEHLNDFFAPIRSRRQEYSDDPDIVNKVLQVGNDKARAIAVQTLQEVRKAMGMHYF